VIQLKLFGVRIIITVFCALIGVVLAAPGIYGSLYSPSEVITAQRQLIAIGLGIFTQFWVGILLERTRPWLKYLARCVLAGLAAGAAIGLIRDGFGVHWDAGVETGISGTVGWLGAEVVFAAVARAVGERTGLKIGGENESA
jgi:hypothetical protein